MIKKKDITPLVRRVRQKKKKGGWGGGRGGHEKKIMPDK